MLVVDTSVAVKWVIPENGVGIETDTSLALDLLSYPLAAPDCILAEFANALFKKVQAKEIAKMQAKQSVEILPSIVAFLPIQSFIGDALDLAFELQHPVHDCLFLAMAIRQRIKLVTADLKFLKRCNDVSLAYPIYSLASGYWR